MLKHRHRHADTHTPVHVPQPACSSRWRDSAAFSSRTVEEPFLREGQGGRGGVAKVNKLYRMELLERFEAPRRVWPRDDGKKKGMKRLRQPGATPYCCCLDTIHRERIACCVWSATEGHAHTNTHKQSPSGQAFLFCSGVLESLAQIYWHLLRFCNQTS